MMPELSVMPNLDDEWVLAQLKDGAITTLDLLGAWELELQIVAKKNGGYLPAMTPSGESFFKQKCNKILNKLVRYGQVEKCGMCMIRGARYQTWAVKE